MTIWDVRVTSNPADVAACRLLGGVNSRDTTKGCGSTVQPSPEECLRYQVRYAGGDTLLIDGPMGKAYDCSGGAASASPETSAGIPAPAAAALPPPTRPPTPAPVPATPGPPVSSPPAPPAVPAAPAVRFSRARDAAKGCVYLGDISAGVDCSGSPSSAACAARASEAGGNLVVTGDSGSQIFACPTKP
ncbi:MAG TPA: hypothetical protein VH854_05660 [Thermoanaerobaculia bacterium]|jgi:hypothetical protein|nr:hypothetical protein [Thermoanaerobaculia bacterium]